MDEKVKQFVKNAFRKYYEEKGVQAPPDFDKREYGFGDDNKIDYRHVAFKTEAELKRFFVEKAPLYASFSAAYYEFPDARPMLRKQFKGADLIFEFDVDPEEGKLMSHASIEKAKQDTFKLLDFLEKDFGINEEDVRVSFSGNRGFHIYVLSEGVRMLNAEARREIVEYVKGEGLDIKKMLSLHPTLDSYGWKGRFAKAALEYSLSSSLKAFADKELVREKISKGEYNFFKGYLTRWDFVLKKQKVSFSVDIDQMVTLDIHKLIRMPSTIHGGSSLLCQWVENLDSYDPFRQAIVMHNYPVRVKMVTDVKEFELNDLTFGPFKKNEEKSLPEYVAMLLICKKVALPQV